MRRSKSLSREQTVAERTLRLTLITSTPKLSSPRSSWKRFVISWGNGLLLHQSRCANCCRAHFPTCVIYKLDYYRLAWKMQILFPHSQMTTKPATTLLCPLSCRSVVLFAINFCMSTLNKVGHPMRNNLSSSSLMLSVINSLFMPFPTRR